MPHDPLSPVIMRSSTDVILTMHILSFHQDQYAQPAPYQGRWPRRTVYPGEYAYNLRLVLCVVLLWNAPVLYAILWLSQLPVRPIGNCAARIRYELMMQWHDQTEARRTRPREYSPWYTIYRKLSNIRGTKSKNLNVSRLVVHLSLPNLLKPGVK